MTIESVFERIQPSDSKPTYVPLFRYGQAKLEACRAEHEALAKYDKLFQKQESYWHERTVSTDRLIAGRQEAIIQTANQIISATSQVTIGRGYLKFLDEFLPQGLTEGQTLDFFKICLSLNMLQTNIYQIGKGQLETFFLRHGSKDFEQSRFTPALQKAARRIPDWFHGSYQDYYTMMTKYSTIGLLLHPEMEFVSKEEQLRMEKQEEAAMIRGEYVEQDKFGATVPEGVPDWMSDDKEAPPRALVEEELRTDETDLVLLKKEYARLRRAVNYLYQSLSDKIEGSYRWLSQGWDEIRIDNPCLGDFLSFLYLHSGNLNYSIGQYVNLEGRLTDPEAMALWIEENFKIAGIVSDGRITQDGRKTLDHFISAHRPDPNSSDIELFRAFRTLNKKGYNVLNFDLGPFIKQLNQEDLSLVAEFFNEQQDDMAGPFISILADLVVERVHQAVDSNTMDSALQKATREYRDFLKKFLRHNWQELYQQFKNILFPTQDTIQTAEILSAPEVSRRSLTDEPSDLVKEFEEEVRKIEQGNLAGWKLLYTRDETSNERSLIEIAGETLAQRSQSMTRLFNRLGTSYSIKVGSIIHALDWKTQVPKEIEQLTPAILVKGERWKKIKRQNVRILYRMFPDEGKIIFFVYQKKAWTYDLPAV